MLEGYSKNGLSKLIIGTHLGDFSKEVSDQYVEALKTAMSLGLSIDGAINYRGMCSEKDEGLAIREVIKSGKLKREDIFISSKAGLLFGDVKEGLNPKKYLEEKLSAEGITIDDFVEYEGLFHTLNPNFYEHALNKSLENLGIETLDLHYMHMPEVSRLKYSEEVFYDKVEKLIDWYESKVKEGKIKSYGIALEFMAEDAEENCFHFEMEQLVEMAKRVAEKNGTNHHLKYVIFECNPMCTDAIRKVSQRVNGELLTLSAACKKLGLETVASMPFAMGDAFEKYTKEQLLDFAFQNMDHVICGSKNKKHIEELDSWGRL